MYHELAESLVKRWTAKEKLDPFMLKEFDKEIREWLEQKASQIQNHNLVSFKKLNVKEILGLSKPSPAPDKFNQMIDLTMKQNHEALKQMDDKNFTEPERVWPCEHIKWIKRGTAHAAQGDFWGFAVSGHHQNLCNLWRECPICLAKRPAEKPRTPSLIQRLKDPRHSFPCSGRNGELENFDNGFKCFFSKTQIGRDWGGFCPGHEKLINELEAELKRVLEEG